MGDHEMIESVRAELLRAEHVLSTEFSFDLAESNYVRCLEVIRSAPDAQPQFEILLTDLFQSKQISDEPLAYLMHQLRWSGVRDWLQEQLRSMPDAIATGTSFEKVLDAYSDDWENREFYKAL